MTVCRFFLQGYCRFGSSCRFEHTNNDPYRYTNYGNTGSRNGHAVTAFSNATTSNVTTDQLVNQVVTDVNAAINGRQWILSAYAPFKSKPNFPGFQDISPEELRLQFYESRAKGTTAQIVNDKIENEIARLQAETFEKMKSLIKPNRVLIEIIESLYRNENPKDPFQTGSLGFSQNSTAFGQNSNTMISQSQSNMFGGGTMTNSNPASSLFANAAKNLFQNPSVNINNATAFGSGFQMESAPMVDGFGIPNQQQKSAFGMMPSNQAAQSFQNNIFSPPQNTFSVFGNPQNSTFGLPSTTISPSTLFSNANQALDQSPAMTSNVFGQTTTEQNDFNKPQFLNANPFLNSAPSNPFGMSNSANVFGSNEISTEGIYSKIEELSKEEIEAYKSESFHRGSIPVNPPALELCN